VYLEHQKVDPDRRAVLVRHARALMGEEEAAEPARPVDPQAPHARPEMDRIARTGADSPVEGTPGAVTPTLSVDDDGAPAGAAGVARPS
jgi:hypothetical protein